jgi:hypothetical protein
VGGKRPGQCHLERRERSPQAPCGKRGQHVRIPLLSDQGGEHAPATDPGQVCHDTVTLDVRVLQPCTDPMLGLTPGLDKGHAGARQVAPHVAGGGGTMLGRTSPWARSAAIQPASALSGCRPLRRRLSCACPTSTSSPPQDNAGH